MDVGYDPDWSKWGVGSILQIEVMKDLLGDHNRPEIFDFSTGIGEHKTRFGNSSRSEINLLLLKNCPRNAFLAAAFTATAAVDKQLRRSMERLGVKASLKRWLRRRA
jgi:CelD/BcsL family acetyltransferase involved in cellulose biosynthesis